MLSYFPSGLGEKVGGFCVIDNPKIQLSAFYMHNGSYTVRLFCGSDKPERAMLTIFDKKYELEFEKYEVKTYSYDTETGDIGEI